MSNKSTFQIVSVSDVWGDVARYGAAIGRKKLRTIHLHNCVSQMV